jgi:hypothetical protein
MDPSKDCGWEHGASVAVILGEVLDMIQSLKKERKHVNTNIHKKTLHSSEQRVQIRSDIGVPNTVSN